MKSKTVKLGTFGWLLCASTLLIQCGQAAPVIGADATEIHQLLQQRVARDEGVGIVVGLIDAQGSQIISAGTLTRNGTQLVDGDTIFDIASVTKTFTATLLAELETQRQLSVSDPLAQFLPTTVQVPTQNGRNITLLDLATHTSGLPENHPGYTGLDEDFSPEQMAQSLTGSSLKGSLGVTFAYSNWGYALLGDVLTRKTGLDYETLVRQRICAPLQMNSTSLTLSEEQQKRFAPGYSYGQQVIQGRKYTLGMASVGGLRSTANDMLRFVAANLNLDNPALAPAMQDAQTMRRFVKSGLTKQIGLAWLAKSFPGGTILWHGGASAGYHSFIGFVPGQHRGVVVLSNTENEVRNLGLHILDRDLPPAEDMEMFEGHYEIDPEHLITVTHEGSKLVTQVTGDRKIWLIYKSGLEFYNPGRALDYAFVRNNAGRIVGAVVHQGAQTWQARWVSALSPADFAPEAVTATKDLAPESATAQLSRPSPRLGDDELAQVAAIIGSYDGQYEISPGHLIAITHDGTKLVTQIAPGHEVRLVPKSVTQFANSGLALEYTFVKNEAGDITEVIIRHGEQTLRARRVTTPEPAVALP